MSYKNHHFLFCSALCCLLLLVSGCGFSPLYATKPAQQTKAGKENAAPTIHVAPISGREGRILRQYLIRRLANGQQTKNPPYALATRITITQKDAITLRDTSTRRIRLAMAVDYHLTRNADQEVILQDRILLNGAYHAGSLQFARLQARRDLLDRLAQEMAARIAQKLHLQLHATALGVH